MRNWDEIDIDELAEFVSKARHSEGVTSSLVKASLHDARSGPSSVIVIARLGGKIAGYLRIITGDWVFPYFDDWQPALSCKIPLTQPGSHEAEVASALIRQSIRYVSERKLSRLEVYFHLITSEMEHSYEHRRSWYESNGMPRMHEEIAMTRPINDDIAPVNLPPPLRCRRATEADRGKLQQAYFETFRNSADGYFHDVAEDQRLALFNDYFNWGYPVLEDASLVLLADNEIAGFCVARPTQELAKLGPIGIHPNYRRRGLGKALLGLTLSHLAQKRVKGAWLELDAANQAAHHLYLSMGFKDHHRIILHRWKRT